MFKRNELVFRQQVRHRCLMSRAVDDKYRCIDWRSRCRGMLWCRNIYTTAETAFNELCQKKRRCNSANTVHGRHTAADTLNKGFVLGRYSIPKGLKRRARDDTVLFDT